MHIQLLLNEILLLGFGITLPLLIRHLPTIQHGSMRNRVFTPITLLRFALLHLLLEFLQVPQVLLLLLVVGFVALFILVAL